MRIVPFLVLMVLCIVQMILYLELLEHRVEEPPRESDEPGGGSGTANFFEPRRYDERGTWMLECSMVVYVLIIAAVFWLRFPVR